MTPTMFKAQQLRAENQSKAVSSIMVFVAMLFISALLPNFLIRYVYATMELTTEPKLLEVIPLLSFVISIVYFLYVVATNIMRSRTIIALEKKADEECACCGCGDECCSMDMEDEDEMMAELQAMASKATQKSAKKKAAKKSK